MELKPVESTLIAAWGYDRLLATLTVQLHNGTRYRYYDVPPELAEQLMSAESAGQFFLRHIKGRFDFEKV